MARRKITPDQLDNLEFDDRGRLYWHGEPIVTDARLALSKTQNILAILVGASAFLGGLGSFAQGIVAVLQ